MGHIVGQALGLKTELCYFFTKHAQCSSIDNDPLRSSIYHRLNAEKDWHLYQLSIICNIPLSMRAVGLKAKPSTRARI